VIDAEALALPLRAAAPLGKLTAQALLSREEAFGALLWAARRARLRGDRSGWQAELAWALDDATLQWDRRAAQAEFAIRKVLAPLLAAGRSSRDLIAAAIGENARAGGPLTRASVLDVVRQEVSWALRRGMVRRAG
jgi:hypothetical protein